MRLAAPCLATRTRLAPSTRVAHARRLDRLEVVSITFEIRESSASLLRDAALDLLLPGWDFVCRFTMLDALDHNDGH